MAFGDQALAYVERKKAGMYALLSNWAGQLEGYAKENAAWTDRTGHARQGLHAGVEARRAGGLVLYLSHGVEYGTYLEVACKPKAERERLWGQPGPYAIVDPTMDAHLSRIRQSILDYWGK
ncbi:MAG: hypothetical protein QME79_13190 [Bacillota bacterium]|nr:hypothetical protein [Bacillota bacterium]